MCVNAQNRQEVEKMQSKNAKILASLRRFSLFASMSDEQLLDVLPQLAPRETKHLAGETIVQANTPAESILIVLEGAATAYRTTAGGRYFIAEVYPTGWLFGENAVFSSPSTWPFSVDMTKPGRLLWLRIGPLKAQMRENPQSALILQVLQQCMDLKNKMLIQNISRSAQGVRDKLLTYFDLMNDKFGGLPFRLQMSREDFASYLGIGRSSLYRELRALQKERLITIDAENLVSIHRARWEQFPRRE